MARQSSSAPARRLLASSCLSRWLDAAGMTRDQAADQLSINRNYLDMLCRGARRPGLSLAVAIEKLTKGAVPATGWVDAGTFET
jgi:hypothetical protein